MKTLFLTNLKIRLAVAIFLTFPGGSFFIPAAHAQNGNHVAGDNFGGGNFIKRVEYNLIYGWYNLDSKDDIEKLFFGDFNAPVEFISAPSFEVKPCIPSGFRIVRDSTDTAYILEIKYISNYEEAMKEGWKEAADERHKIDIPVHLLDTLPREIFNLVLDYNKSIRGKKYCELLSELYKVETLSFAVSNRFAEELYQKTVSLIDNFKAEGVPPLIADGYSVTFRTVVADEVWSLDIHMPQGNSLKMADLSRKIITDAKSGKLDEEKYIRLLDGM